MTNEGIKKCFAVLNGAYMNFYKSTSKEDWMLMKETWNIQFNNCADLSVFTALQKAISVSEYPPTIASIKKHMLPDTHMSAEEMWDILLKAGSNGLYNSIEEWEKLPDSIKKITTPNTIREIALSNYNSLPYIKKDVFNAYENLKVDENQKLLTNTLGLLQIEEEYEQNRKE